MITTARLCAAAAAVVCSLFATITLGDPKYPLPLHNVKARDICGSSRCSPGNGGGTFHFTKDPYFISPAPDEDLNDIARRLVGRVRISRDQGGGVPWSCPGDVLTRKEVETKINGLATNYSKKTTLNIDSSMRARANALELAEQLQVKTREEIATLEAKLEAAYKKVNTKGVTLVAKYFEVGLTDDKFRTYFQEGTSLCSQEIREKPLQLITDVGLISFDVDSNADLVDDIAGEVSGEIGSKGASGDARAKITNVIATTISQSLKGQYAIIAERRASSSDFYSVLLAEAEARAKEKKDKEVNGRWWRRSVSESRSDNVPAPEVP